ncbi:hypothetical protein K469DRAFT_630931, partial [Zopfia rhizophila CBS 207.26]
MHSLAGVTKGKQEIAAGRPKSWNGIASRHHQPLKVYTSNPDSSDILLTGKITANLTNGKSVNAEMVAQFILNGDTNTSPKIASYKAWGV